MKSVLALLLLSGCAASPPYWVHADPDWKAVETVEHYLDVTGQSSSIQAWTFRDKSTSVCHIFIGRYVANRECVLAHEKRHCEGWDHPNYKLNMGCGD